MSTLPVFFQKSFSLFSFHSFVKKTEEGEHAPKIRLSRQEKIFFLDTLGSLLSAGIPMVKSLQLIYFQSDVSGIKALAMFLKTQIEQGKNLGSIARSLVKIFSNFDSAMFEMGDATGKIGDTFRILTHKEEKALDLERKVRGALIYPIAIVVVALLMVTILLTYVVPRIEKIYMDAHTSLPALTRAVIGFSDFLRTYGILTIVAIVILIGLWSLALKDEKIRQRFDLALLRIPLFGMIMKRKTLVIFTEFLAILLSSGITIHRALEIVASAMTNSYYKAEIESIILAVKSGQHLSTALGGAYVEARIRGEVIEKSEQIIAERRIQCFTMELSTAVKVGEQTGSLATMLAKSSDRYNNEIDTTVKTLSSLLEPAVIIVIGGIVGIIVLAIMMPFFNMVQVVG